VTRGAKIERVQHALGSVAAPWITTEDSGPIACPLEQLAEILGLDVELVEAAAQHVAPYTHADGSLVWSVRQVGVLLGVRKAHYLTTSAKRRYEAAKRRRAATQSRVG